MQYVVHRVLLMIPTIFIVAFAAFGLMRLVPGALGLIAGRSGLEAVPVGTVVLAGVLWLLHEGLVRRPDVGATTGWTVC